MVAFNTITVMLMECFSWKERCWLTVKTLKGEDVCVVMMKGLVQRNDVELRL